MLHRSSNVWNSIKGLIFPHHSKLHRMIMFHLQMHVCCSAAFICYWLNTGLEVKGSKFISNLFFHISAALFSGLLLLMLHSLCLRRCEGLVEWRPMRRSDASPAEREGDQKKTDNHAKRNYWAHLIYHAIHCYRAINWCTPCCRRPNCWM